MTDVAIQALRRRLDAILARYRFRFAKKPRITRSLHEMDALIGMARDLRGEVVEVAGSDDELCSAVTAELQLLEDERHRIVSAKAAGGDALEARVLTTRADFVSSRYRRHFANRDRTSRDIGLLEELAESLGAASRRLAALAAANPDLELGGTVEATASNVALYEAELEAIPAARAQLTPAQLAGVLARVANGQFGLYRAHFAELPRLSRRPALLERIIATLTDARREMAMLKARGLESEDNARNMEIVTSRLGAYEAELELLVPVQAEADVAARAAALNEEAQRVMQGYEHGFAGQGRATRDLDQLTVLCDAMSEAETQLTELVATSPGYLPLVAYVRDALHMLEVEHQLIYEARRQ